MSPNIQIQFLNHGTRETPEAKSRVRSEIRFVHKGQVQESTLDSCSLKVGSRQLGRGLRLADLLIKGSEIEYND